MVSDLINRPCTIFHRTGSGVRNAHGVEESDVDPVDAVWELQQTNRAEPGDQSELSDTLWTAFFLPGVELSTGDTVVDEDGTRYEVVGDPWHARNPRSRTVSHVEATLRRTAGPEVAS